MQSCFPAILTVAASRDCETSSGPTASFCSSVLRGRSRQRVAACQPEASARAPPSDTPPPEAPVLMLRCLFSAEKGTGKSPGAGSPWVLNAKRGPGAGSPWLLTIAPVGARKPRNFKNRQRGSPFRPPPTAQTGQRGSALRGARPEQSRPGRRLPSTTHD